MSCQKKSLVGLAVALTAMAFARPASAASAETYASIVGLGDMTGQINNPSFEADRVPAGQKYLVNTVSGWNITPKSGFTATCAPTSSEITGAGGSSLPTPSLPVGLATPSCIPPVGFTVAPSGNQVLAIWKDASIAQAVHAVNNPGVNFTTAAHQTYVMTWEFGCPATVGDAGGWSVGVFYGSSSAFMLVNNDTDFTGGGHYANTRGVMYQYSWSFTTDSSPSYVGKNMTIRLSGGTSTGTGYDYFDNIHLYGPVPEPTTVALLVSGALGLLAYAWRRRRAAH